ncbi:MAG: hypothetical protein ACLGIN_05145 [Candidatus Sericytochromatia bacterium]
MNKLLLLTVTSALLAGCGQAPGLIKAQPQYRPGAVEAQSKAGTERGVRNMFKAIFSELDKDYSGDLRLDELPPRLSFAGMPLDAEGPEALLRRLDLNMDGGVTLREFYRREFLFPVLEKFRLEIGREFVALDKNGDRTLTEDELAGSRHSFADLDRNMNGKLTMSEFEDGAAAALEHNLALEPMPGGEG